MAKIQLELPEKVKILAISGAHRKGWNTDYLLEEAVTAAKLLGPWVDVEVINLCDYNIEPCESCYRCYVEGSPGNWCPAHDDDMDNAGIYEKVIAADALLVSTSVYWGSMTGKMKDFIDRTLPFCHGSCTKNSGVMSTKVGAALAVGVDIHGGMEMTIMDLHAWMFTHDMIVVGAGYHHPHGCYVGGACGTQIGVPSFGRDSAKFDIFGMRSVNGTGRKIAETALFVKIAKEACKAYDQYLPKADEKAAELIDWDKFYQQMSHLPREHVGVPARIGTSKAAFENWLKTMSGRSAEDAAKGKVFGKGKVDVEGIRKAWTEHHNVVFVSDEDLIKYSPQYYGQYLK